MPLDNARIRVLTDRPVNAAGRYVLYWMIAQRRLTWNFSLDRACWWARELGAPLVIFEPLEAGYRWASDRLHRFVLDGMADNAAALEGRTGVTYLPWVEPRHGEQRGLLSALAAEAAVVITDDYPAFNIPRLLDAARSRLAVRLEAIDSNGLVPMRLADRAYPTALGFRRYLQQTLPRHLGARPAPDPLADLPAGVRARIPESVFARWDSPTHALITGAAPLSTLDIDHDVGIVGQRGGSRAAAAALARFLDERLAAYGATRNRVEDDVTSGLSPYLHFGHISSWEVTAAVLARDGWIGQTASRATGGREGWWGASPAVEGFLDQVVTWRELGFNMCALNPENYARYDSLPPWAQATLGKHAADPRKYRYGLKEFAEGRTHDQLWNAAQGQLVAEGRIHNYLRMLWGKKILEWTDSPADALAIMVELNNRYALDGRDPNSYSGIFWTLGRYDRPWAPERPVFGTVRYMSSENTARKMPVRSYIRRYAPVAGRTGEQPALLDLN
jgi:deoxyribodipyrimidine photo-lyase